MTIENLEIIDYRTEHAAAFRDLNVAWITHYFNLEPRDEAVLENPVDEILNKGGAILIAELNGVAIGTCALTPVAPATLELSKMAVATATRGQGIGRALGDAALLKSVALGASQIVLETNHKLTSALALYKRLGFEKVPPTESEFERCDIRMICKLTSDHEPT